jgi:hypothetical protein
MATINSKSRRPAHVRLKRRIKLAYLRIIRMGDPPERIAMGAAIGVFSGIAPTFGAAAPLAFAAAFVLKANKTAAVLGSFIMNPLTSTFFWSFSIILGSVILGENPQSILETVREESLLSGITRAWVVFLTGNAVIAVPFTVAAYYLTKGAIVRHRRRKAKRRAIGYPPHRGV